MTDNEITLAPLKREPELHTMTYRYLRRKVV